MVKKKPTNDQTVQETNDNSILSKASITKLGYFDDPYLRLFASRSARRAPLIHRGYYIRAKAIDYSLTTFLQQFKEKACQIVSLGAGFDSSYFRLKNKDLLRNCVYIEIDFPDVVRRKEAIIKKHNELLDIIGNHSIDQNNVLQSHDFKLIPCDLTQTSLLKELLTKCNIDFNSPTLFFSECVLTYVEYEQSKNLLSWLQTTFENSVTVIYEQIQPNDAFGHTMLKHFRKIQSPLQRIHSLHDTQAHKDLFASIGYKDVHGFDMNFFYDNYLSDDEKIRMCQLELFDEYEEWHLKCSHYAIIAAIQGCCSSYALSMFPLEQTLLNATHNCTIDMKGMQNDDHNLKRYGHSTSIDVENQQYFLCGGFGVTSTQGHEKLKNGLLFSLDTMGQVFNSKQINTTFQRMFHTAVFVDKDLLFVFGGRTSPKHVSKEYGFYKIQDSELRPITVYSLEDTTNADVVQPVGRWRHSMVKVEAKLFLYGGRSVDKLALNDVWMYDLNTNQWATMNNINLPPSHSHSMNYWDEHIVIYGGLSSTMQASNLFHTISLKDMSCVPVKFKPPLPCRYSHTAHVVNTNYLLVIGGINPHSSETTDLLLISLTEHTWKNIRLPLSDPERPVMLHNHCSILQNESKVVVVGGGGNCFSFGTHFNDGLTVLDIADVISK